MLKVYFGADSNVQHPRTKNGHQPPLAAPSGSRGGVRIAILSSRRLIQERQQIGMMADHFPLAVFLAEGVGGADGDFLGFAVDDVLAFFVTGEDSQVGTEGEVDVFRLDFAAEVFGGLGFPGGEDVVPAALDAACGAHVGNVVVVGPDLVHQLEVALKHVVERGVEIIRGLLDGLLVVLRDRSSLVAVLGRRGGDDGQHGDDTERDDAQSRHDSDAILHFLLLSEGLGMEVELWPGRETACPYGMAVVGRREALCKRSLGNWEVGGQRSEVGTGDGITGRIGTFVRGRG